MKTSIVIFKNRLVEFDYLETISQTFSFGGIVLDTVHVLDYQDDLLFTRIFLDSKDMVDNLIVVGDNAGFDVKEKIASLMETPLQINDNALNVLAKLKNAEGRSFDESFACIPEDAILIPNSKGAFQGFFLESNEFSVAMLPSEKEQLVSVCNEYVLPYLYTKFGIKREIVTLKHFGSVEKLKSILDSAIKSVKNKVEYNIDSKFGDNKITIAFSGEDIQQDKGLLLRELVGALKENIYAEYDVSLSERLFDLLKLRKLKISVAESFTGGRVVSSIIANSGASDFVNEGLVAYSNLSKKKRLSVKQSSLVSEGAVSSVVAYEMSAGLLKEGDCDVAISTTGIAGPNSDNTLKPVGLCYIAVGLRSGIHVYKFNFTGDRETITETAKNTALYLAIKTLKNIK